MIHKHKQLIQDRIVGGKWTGQFDGDTPIITIDDKPVDVSEFIKGMKSKPATIKLETEQKTDLEVNTNADMERQDSIRDTAIDGSGDSQG
jgi:hypothetical protein